VSQPWYGGDSLTGIAVLQKQARVQPGAAGVSQPWFWKHARSGWIAIVAQRRPVGGLCTNTAAVALPYHGGLTPAALVDVRLCIAKIVFRRKTFASQHKSGGRKPPVVREPIVPGKRTQSEINGRPC
jgi:hypothetical protein